jgi:hypothetical protein
VTEDKPHVDSQEGERPASGAGQGADDPESEADRIDAKRNR